MPREQVPPRIKQQAMRRKLPKLDPLGEVRQAAQWGFPVAADPKCCDVEDLGKNTRPECAVASLLNSLGLLPEHHVSDLPGRPDFVLREFRIAIFVDGDFWHGWRFPTWRKKLSEKWEAKIEATRKRDTRNHSRLRRAGWKVLRIWEHQVLVDPERVAARIAAMTAAATPIRDDRNVV